MITDMKFQSLMAGIMHGTRLPTRAALVALFMGFLSGCMGIRETRRTFGSAASSPAVTVDGTAIRMQLKPEGTAPGSIAVSAMVVGGAITTLDGPFRWRLEAAGEPGKQEYLVVHRIRTRTSKTGRDEWYPADKLGKRADFTRPEGGAGATRAVYPIPGLLRVMPLEDGALDVEVDLTLATAGKKMRRSVKFRLEPSEKRQDEFVFIPTEIVESIGKSTADWDDKGWD
jgi:hypothetical protein